MTEIPESENQEFEEIVEPLESYEEEVIEEKVEEEEAPPEMPMKHCIFCGALIPAPSKACPKCTHALGPFEPTTPKQYFRWFFCGLMIFIGTLMPCGPDWGTMTIRTMLGGLFAIMGLGVMWNMWSAIYSGRFKMFWILMLFIPIIIGVWRFTFALPAPEIFAKYNAPTNWNEFIQCFSSAPPNWQGVRNFFWVVGYGITFITLGSILAWVLLIFEMFRAKSHSKKKAAERGGERRSRRK